MVDVVTLTCLSCGGKLEITQDIDRFACAHCGTEHLVRRGGGIVWLDLVLQELAAVEAKVDRTASQLAMAKLKEEVEELEQGVISNRDAVGQAILISVLSVLSLGALIWSGLAHWQLLLVCGPICAIATVAGVLIAAGAYRRNRYLTELVNKRRAEIRHHRQVIKATSDEQPEETLS